jgi:hypothetical protein
VRVKVWGARGAVPTPGRSTNRYGGNTSCVQVTLSDGRLLVLDAGSGIRNLGLRLAGSERRIDILLTHLHVDHIQGCCSSRPCSCPRPKSSSGARPPPRCCPSASPATSLRHSHRFTCVSSRPGSPSASARRATGRSGLHVSMQPLSPTPVLPSAIGSVREPRSRGCHNHRSARGGPPTMDHPEASSSKRVTHPVAAAWASVLSPDRRAGEDSGSEICGSAHAHPALGENAGPRNCARFFEAACLACRNGLLKRISRPRHRAILVCG